MCSTLSTTGHRTKRLFGNKWPNYADDVIKDYAKLKLQTIRPDKVLTGGAIGWDQGVARAASDLDVPFDLYIPFEGFEKYWPWIVREKFKLLKSKADNVTVVSPNGFQRRKYQIRNEAMLNNSTEVLACWDYQEHGGTYNAINYAVQNDMKVVNCWNSWTKFQREQLKEYHHDYRV